MESSGQNKAEKRKYNAKQIGALVAIGVLILFAAINSQEVEVHFLFTTTQAPLIVIIFASAVLGMIIDRLLQYQQRRKRRQNVN